MIFIINLAIWSLKKHSQRLFVSRLKVRTPEDTDQDKQPILSPPPAAGDDHCLFFFQSYAKPTVVSCVNTDLRVWIHKMFSPGVTNVGCPFSFLITGAIFTLPIWWAEQPAGPYQYWLSPCVCGYKWTWKKKKALVRELSSECNSSSNLSSVTPESFTQTPEETHSYYFLMNLIRRQFTRWCRRWWRCPRMSRHQRRGQIRSSDRWTLIMMVRSVFPLILGCFCGCF